MRLILAIAIFASVAYWQFGMGTSGYPTDRLARQAEGSGSPLGRSGVLAGMPSVPLASQLEPGHITVFVFSGRWCPACRQLERHIRRFAGLRQDVAFKFVEADDRASAEYNIASVPHVVLFDAEGRQIAADNGSDKSAHQMLANWMNDESRRAFESRP